MIKSCWASPKHVGSIDVLSREQSLVLVHSFLQSLDRLLGLVQCISEICAVLFFVADFDIDASITGIFRRCPSQCEDSCEQNKMV